MLQRLLLIPIRGEAGLEEAASPYLSATESRGRLGQALVALTQVLFLHLASRDWIRYLEGGNETRLVLATLFTAAFILSFWSSSFTGARWLALGTILFKFAVVFPNCSNHLYVETLAVSFVATTSIADDEQRITLLSALRWLPAIVLIWSGVQKMLYGSYFDGAYLAYAFESRGFSELLSKFVSVEELRSLREIEPPGPYRFRTASGIVLSNVAYLGEIASGFLLLIPKARRTGWIFAMAMLIAIELGAREILFGLLMTTLLLLYLDARWMRFWRWVALPVYLYFILAAAGLTPTGGFN